MNLCLAAIRTWKKTAKLRQKKKKNHVGPPSTYKTASLSLSISKKSRLGLVALVSGAAI